MFRVESVHALYDHIAYVVLYAPDRFPVEDYLAPEQQMTLDRAFELLRDGVLVAFPDDFHPEKRPSLYSVLERSLAAYRIGNEAEGAGLLHEFENNIFKAR